jgi:hypothetical protein
MAKNTQCLTNHPASRRDIGKNLANNGMLYKHSDSNQKQTIFACPRCTFQLKNSIIKINFDYIEKEVNYDCNCK